MRKISPSIFGLVLLCAPVFGCDDDDNDDVITTRASATADFTDFRTFAFPEPSDTIDELNEDIPADVATNISVVNDAMRTQLTALGLEEVDSDEDPDLIAFNLASTEDREALSWECVDGYWYGYWTYDWDPCAWLAPVYTEYTAGVVFVGLADPEDEEVVFGGLIQGVGEGDEDQDELEERIQDDVADVFEDYPADQTGS